MEDDEDLAQAATQHNKLTTNCHNIKSSNTNETSKYRDTKELRKQTHESKQANLAQAAMEDVDDSGAAAADDAGAWGEAPWQEGAQAQAPSKIV